MRSIFDVLNDYYYNNDNRKTQMHPSDMIYNRPNGPVFTKERIRRGLNINQKMTVFKFLVAMDNAKELTTHDLIL